MAVESAYTINNLNEKTNAEIEGFLKKSKEELFNLRFQNATGQLENPSRLKTVKHDIARMYTVLRERELGITVEPAAAEVKDESESKAKKAKATKTQSDETKTEEK
ncbi:large subunit ribosomal protein L29 [Bifidobacterium bohemicum]|uniref:Large ribosomal subunit protein uL29 n=1 Tax=Bifidobacterium bohemicum DSM 22767 TaxID=1437606 RepID=A0A086ZEC8_9BIFI|nr:50S ribosomal protein L29 [Bifidobacterium bohemicum DSM 22767]SCB96239.1 large subunit ribosomal protein L29 [Bifidobacterium bohemicum]